MVPLMTGHFVRVSSKKQKQQQQQQQQLPANGVIAYSMSTMFSDPKSVDEMDLDEAQIEALLNKQTQKWTIFSMPVEGRLVMLFVYM